MGVSPQEFIARKQQEAKEQWLRQQQAQQQQQQQGQGQGKPPGQPGPPGQQVQHVNLNQGVEAKPEALAVAKFLRSQNLKCRTCIFDGQRKDMFKGNELTSPSDVTYLRYQSKEHFVHSSPPRTPKRAPRILSYQPSPTRPKRNQPSSNCLCPCLLSESSRKTLMKATITLQAKSTKRKSE